MKKNEKAITLIALVITIIVLLILAGVAIAALKNTGLIGKTKDAQLKSLKAEAEEKLKLLLYEYHIANAESGISLEDFLNEKLAKNEIEDVNITEEGIEIYIDGFYAIIDGNGNIIEGMQKAGIKPELTYTLSTTEANQDKVTIIVNAISKDENATIANIINPNNEEIAGNETSFEVTKNGLYKFTAVTSIGTKKSIVVEIGNIKISKPVITILQNGGYPILTSHGIFGGISKISIEYEENLVYRNLYSEDNGNSWKEYIGEITTTTSQVLAKSVLKSDTNISSEATTITLNTLASDAVPYGVWSETTNESITLGKGSYQSRKMAIDESMYGKNILVTATFSTYTGWGAYSTIDFHYKDTNSWVNYLSTSNNTPNYNNTPITIPKNVDYIRFAYSGGGDGRMYLTLSKVKIDNSQKFQTEIFYPTITSSKFVEPYENVTINYFETNVQKLYKIDDNPWEPYNDIPIKLNVGETLYAKGIDKNNKEVISTCSFARPSDSVPREIYDPNLSGSITLGKGSYQSRKMAIDESMYGKNILVTATFSTYTGWGAYSTIDFHYKDTNSWVNYLSTSNNTPNYNNTPITIPKNVDYIRFAYSGGGDGRMYLTLNKIKIQ